MWRLVLGAILSGLCLMRAIPAPALGLDPAFHGALLGPDQARGVFVWSHGRSISYEDWKSPNPPYLRTIRKAGWDVLRFDRLRANDTLSRSSRRLADYAAALKEKGYRRVVLAGQSFGAFLALMAADRAKAVDAVVATAPAAFGSFTDFYGSWRLNATRLYPVLRKIKRARVMLFYFHDDDFDPGGRGVRSRRIFVARGLPFAVIDQPAYLTGHWAASTGLFLRRFGSCIRRFIGDDELTGQLVCAPIWGNTPSADLALPAELRHPNGMVKLAAQRPAGSGSDAVPARGPIRDVWYGLYPNGREVLLAVEHVDGRHLSAVYAIGPGIGKNEPAEWIRRHGVIADHRFVFAAPGKSTLRFRPLDNGGLEARWIGRDGTESMTAALRRIDPAILARSAANLEAQPQ